MREGFGRTKRAAANSWDCATARIQHAFAARQAHREVVARHVLVEQVDIDLAGDQPFAGELSQGDSPVDARCVCAR